MSIHTLSKPESSVLSDGTRVFVESDHRIPLVSIDVIFPGGYAHDPLGKEGLARLAGRALRRGVDGMHGSEFEAAIDALGGEFHLEVSATATQLHGQVIARNVVPFVDLLARMFAFPTATDDELLRAAREATSELAEARDNDRVLVHRAFRAKLFGDHGYGRSVLGSEQTLASITPADLRAFHTRRFGRAAKPRTMGFAGAVTRELAERLGETLVAALPANSQATPVSSALPPPANPPKGRHLVFVEKAERAQNQIQIGRLGTSPHDLDHTPLMLANAIFGGSFTSRMMQEIRVKRGWAYGAGSRLPIDRERHEFSMGCATGAEDTAACIALQIAMLEGLVKTGVTPREVKATQKFLSKSWAFEVDTAEKRLGHPLDVATLSLPPDYYDGYTERLLRVSPEEASASAARRLAPDDLVIAVVGTSASTLEAVQKAIPDLASTTVIPYLEC